MYHQPPFVSYRIYPQCHQGCKHQVSYYVFSDSHGVHEVEELWTREEILEKIPESRAWNHFHASESFCDKITAYVIYGLKKIEAFFTIRERP